MRLTLKDDGFAYKKVMQGRRWIAQASTAVMTWSSVIRPSSRRRAPRARVP